MVFGGGDGYPHPTGPVGPPLVALPGIPSECRLWANMARFHYILLKYSQNGEVSPKSHIRPVIVPVSKTALRNHLLKFSDF